METELFEEEKKEPVRYPLKQARREADRLTFVLCRHCKRVEIAGSIRRRRPDVHDIDIVCIPKSASELSRFFFVNAIVPTGGKKHLKFKLDGIPVDLYLADEYTWATLLLIRTGSKEHNIKMCRRAQEMGMKLKANGEGIILNEGPRLTIETEGDIFEALGLPYKEPWEREA